MVGAGGAVALADAGRNGSAYNSTIRWLTRQKPRLTDTIALVPEGPAGRSGLGGCCCLSAVGESLETKRRSG